MANPGSWNTSPALAPAPAPVAQPSQVIAAQVSAWALAEYKAAGYDDATAQGLANKAAAGAQAAYDEAIAAGKTPIEAAEGAKASSAGGVVGELQKVGVTTLSNPNALNTNGDGTSGAGGIGSPGSPTVTTRDRAAALGTYRDGIQEGQDNLKEIRDSPVNDPSAFATFKPITSTAVAAPKIALPSGPSTTRAVAAGPINVTQAVAQQAQAAGPIGVTRVGPAAPLAATLQNHTGVEGTTLSTDLSDQSRTQQQQAIADLTATSQGKGQAQILAEARAKQDQTKAANLLAASARGDRGAGRKGAAVHARLLANASALEGQQNRDALNAQTAIGAQAALGSTLQGVRSTDVGIEAKRADLQAQRSQLQASLDAAKAANDQNAINTINIKMADLNRQADVLNAEAANQAVEAAAGRQTTTSGLNAQLGTQVATTNAGAQNTAAETAAGRATTVSLGNAAQDNNLKSTIYTTKAGAATQDAGNQLAANTTNAGNEIRVGEANNSGGLAAALGQTTQDVSQAEIRIKINEAIQKAGANLLDQETRDEALKIAKAQLANAQAKADREGQSYWFDKVAALALGAAQVGAKLLAKGGMVSAPTLAMVGEGEHRELVIPISGKLSKALEKRLANESKPFRQPVPVAALISVIRKTTSNLDEVPKIDAKTSARVSAYMTRAKKKAS